MVDFLKSFPFVSIDDYRWKLSVPMIRIMGIDNTRVHYLSDNEIQRRKGVRSNDPNTALNDLGIPIFNGNEIKQ